MPVISQDSHPTEQFPYVSLPLSLDVKFAEGRDPMLISQLLGAHGMC